MKKLLNILLILLMTLSIVACSSNNNEQNNIITDNTQNFNMDATIEETVLFDEENIKITATELTYDDFMATLELKIENNTDKKLSFTSGTFGCACNSINDTMLNEGYINTELNPKENIYEHLDLNYRMLKMYGINEIVEMEICFLIQDDDYNQIFTGPKPIKTSIADGYKYNDDAFQKAITNDIYKNDLNYSINHFEVKDFYDDKNVKITSAGLIKNSDENYLLIVEVLNNTDQEINFCISNITVNGLVISTPNWTNDTINPKKRLIRAIDLSHHISKNAFDILGIKDIGEITFDIKTTDKDNNLFSNKETIKINIPNTEINFDKTGNEVYSNNGINIISKGIVMGDNEYDANMYMILMLSNNSDKTLHIGDVYKSLLVNDYEVDYVFASGDVPPNAHSLIIFDLWSSDLQNIEITEIKDIKKISFAIEISDDDGNVIDNPTITVNY